LTRLNETIEALKADGDNNDFTGYESTIESASNAFDDYEKMSKNLELQQRAIDTIVRKGDPSDDVLLRIQNFRASLEQINSKDIETASYFKEFIQNIQNPDDSAPQEELKKVTKKGKTKQKKFEPVSFNDYETAHSECETILEKYIISENNENLKKHTIGSNMERRSSSSSDGSDEVKKEIEPQDVLEDEDDEDFDPDELPEPLEMTFEQKLKSEILKRDEKMASVMQEIEK
jgi:hypothetical protein